MTGVEVRTMRRMDMGGVSQLVSYGGPNSGVSDDDGKYVIADRVPGAYLVIAMTHGPDRTGKSPETVSMGPAPSVGPDGKLLGYVNTFFPGTAVESEARTVTVETTERTGTDIRLSRRPVFELTGSLSGNPGPTAWVTIAPVSVGDRMGGLNVRRVRLVQGGFRVLNVTDGTYVISFRGVSEWAESTVTIAGASPPPVVLELRPQRVVTGRVTFTGATSPPVLPGSYSTRPEFAVELRPAVMSAGESFISIPLTSSLTFSARAGGGGPLTLQVRVPAPWVQVAGFIDGVDTLDLPYTGAGSTDALIVVADRRTALQVALRDAADQPATDGTVILFSEDPRYWTRPSRRAALVASPGGAVTIPDVPPGRYFVAAARGIAPAQTMTPALIESVKARALPLEIVAGESRSVTLRVY